MNSQTLPRNFNRKKFNILKIKIRKSNSPLNLRLPRSRDAIRLLFHIAKFYFIHSPDYFSGYSSSRQTRTWKYERFSRMDNDGRRWSLNDSRSKRGREISTAHTVFTLFGDLCMERELCIEFPPSWKRMLA